MKNTFLRFIIFFVLPFILIQFTDCDKEMAADLTDFTSPTANLPSGIIDVANSKTAS